ncbi:hypothetical protein FOC1_g10008485 [Fusarium oxysporum f. sp. cubense race 1]|uniref:RRM domain-containing protein n=1 Tax=Fusarium oxysporum f. sp. cubense (strain race 1) TaxID=1229664 RepID=N4UIE4_FUSC1|nr:hypothetical protein FOC1_g10008485 [Fusarium oxysporum f. sp. cubense race 1]
MAQGDSAAQRSGPPASNPPFNEPSFCPQPRRPQCSNGGHQPEAASHVVSNANSWVPSAQQALHNALQASGYAGAQPGMNMMGGHIQGNGMNMAAETVNGTIDGMVNNAALSTSGHISHIMASGATPSSNNSPEHVIVNGSANAATTNQASRGNHLANSNPGDPGGSGIGNRLPHGTQLFATQHTHSGNSGSGGQTSFMSPPHGCSSASQPSSQHSARSRPSTGGQQFYTSIGVSQTNAYNPSLPQSVSYNSGLSLASPSHTPRYYNGHRMSASQSTPNSGPNQHLTEPRNYAPRSSAHGVNSLPPPRFDLGLQAIPMTHESAAQDPFGSPERAEPTALIPFPNLPPPAAQQAMLAAPMAGHFTSNMSPELSKLVDTPSGLPTLETAMKPEFFPFTSGPGSAKASVAGAVRLKNIPFSTKRAEIVAFIGRNSRMLPDVEEPIHIIMDRATSKTMDAFVEFVTMEDAMRCAEKHHQHAQAGRVSRLGERSIEVELSSQSALMQDLFPLAHGVFWDGATPKVLPNNHQEPWENFKGFISPEEMVMLVKHVEVPHRSPFSKECPQRPYECLISTLRKFPWYAADHITISQRGAVYKATIKLLRLLSRSVSQQDDPVNLTSQLFQRVVQTAMQCHGFTALQKDNIAFMVQMIPMEQQRRHHQPANANCWVHQYAITRKPDAPLDLAEWYIRLIREQSTRDVLTRPIHERTVIQETLKETDEYWGYFFNEVKYIQGPQFDQMTLGQCAYLELSAIERILGRALSYN